MPFGFERLNERQQRPNQNIVFIKPLESADKATAQDFLERIAAQCAPVMKANYLYVVALEVSKLDVSNAMVQRNGSNKSRRSFRQTRSS